MRHGIAGEEPLFLSSSLTDHLLEHASPTAAASSAENEANTDTSTSTAINQSTNLDPVARTGSASSPPKDSENESEYDSDDPMGLKEYLRPEDRESFKNTTAKSVIKMSETRKQDPDKAEAGETQFSRRKQHQMARAEEEMHSNGLLDGMRSNARESLPREMDDSAREAMRRDTGGSLSAKSSIELLPRPSQREGTPALDFRKGDPRDNEMEHTSIERDDPILIDDEDVKGVGQRRDVLQDRNDSNSASYKIVHANVPQIDPTSKLPFPNAPSSESDSTTQEDAQDRDQAGIRRGRESKITSMKRNDDLELEMHEETARKDRQAIHPEEDEDTDDLMAWLGGGEGIQIVG